MKKFEFFLLLMLTSVGAFASNTEKGDFDGLAKYVKQRLVLENLSGIGEIQGDVLVDFVVDKDGSVSDVRIVKGLHPKLDAEVVRVLSRMPKWTPLQKDGKPVRSRISCPISFDFMDIGIVWRVEKMAEFVGGSEEMFKFLRENIKYPEDAVSNGVQGRVNVKFVVEKDGSISGIEVVRSVHPSLDAEAVRVVKLMPKWKPAENRGKPVRTKYMLPIFFRIQDVQTNKKEQP